MTMITEDTIANRISRVLADRIITGALIIIIVFFDQLRRRNR